jgi:Domain of unknown function (DUF4037)
MPPFIPGLELSRRFYREAVRPILEERCPSLPHAAAHLGSGSDVLGFDTAMSMDHDWGPMVRLFVRDEDAHRLGALREVMDERLPERFLGHPVRFIVPGASGRAGHAVLPVTVRAFFREYLAYDIDEPLTAVDWLTFPSQRLRAVTAGAVHHDGVGALTALRERFACYPRDVWLYLLAAGWRRVAQEEHLMPRAGFAGDELGSALIGSRLVRDVMSLCFLMERQYAPYPKWFGTAFQQLACAAELTPILWRAQCAPTWQARETALSAAYVALARMHNALAITLRLSERVSVFHDRPFQVIDGDRFAEAIRAEITDPEVQRIATRRLIGGIDQFSDSTDLRDGDWRAGLRGLYL